MFVYNVKISSSKIFKIVFVIIFIIIFCITGLAIFKTFNFSNSKINNNDVYEINSTNYTNILKAVHDDLDTYIGQKIQFSGYIYRVYDLQDDEFVLARDMIINTNNETLVGYYHGDIPLIDISNIEEIKKPSDANVYPPDDFYIPTSTLVYNNP